MLHSHVFVSVEEEEEENNPNRCIISRIRIRMIFTALDFAQTRNVLL